MIKIKIKRKEERGDKGGFARRVQPEVMPALRKGKGLQA
jgi:hypothetical protein